MFQMLLILNVGSLFASALFKIDGTHFAGLLQPYKMDLCALVVTGKSVEKQLFTQVL